MRVAAVVVARWLYHESGGSGRKDVWWWPAWWLHEDGGSSKKCPRTLNQSTVLMAATAQPSSLKHCSSDSACPRSRPALFL